ncbi:MAG TPA: exopolysaccharide biosynthesis protein [Opitutaceae bacterium]|nr:exopolysaccharide biosynthesis protein [Opitutaceae bacterium]
MDDSNHTLGDDIKTLAALAEQGPLTFVQLTSSLKGRAAESILVILSFAFLLIPIPGVSTVSSIVFVALTVSAVFGLPIWLPGSVRSRQISQPTAKSIIATADRNWARIARLVRPRMTFLVSGPFRWLAGFSLLLAIFAFALPIPIPFNNSPPAFCILLLSIGLLGRDGLLTLFGHLATIILWIALFMAGNFLWELAQKVFEKLG